MIKAKSKKDIFLRAVLYAILAWYFFQVATFGAFSITDIWMALTRG